MVMVALGMGHHCRVGTVLGMGCRRADDCRRGGCTGNWVAREIGGLGGCREREGRRADYWRNRQPGVNGV